VPLERCARATIEAALAAPRAGWGIFEKYRAIEAKCAALLCALAKSQACVEGNKRVALLLVDAFVRLNGYTLAVAPGELADQILAAAIAADRDRAIADATIWFRSKLVRLEEEA
jgi:prophage maintenance system killer protein